MVVCSVQVLGRSSGDLQDGDNYSLGGEGNAADFDISDVRSGIRTDSRDAAFDSGFTVAEERETGHSDHNMRNYPHRIDCPGYFVRFSFNDDIRLTGGFYIKATSLHMADIICE